MSRRAASAVLAACATLAGALAGLAIPAAEPAAAATEKDGFRVLVYSRTTGFRHISIAPGVEAIRELGEANRFGVDATEDPSAFTRRNLRRYAAVIFLNTTGTVLERPQKRAFRRYVERGGGFAGIHSAADTGHEWPFYDRLVGALFLSHPLQQFAWFENEAPDHPATAHLDPRFLTFDEFYSFKRNPRPGVRVLLSIDESTYFPDPNTTYLPGNEPVTGVMGDHPMSWCHRVRRGKSFYTALGHEPYLYSIGWYRRHILGGILTAARATPATCRPG
jgi:type 1 glutamine amidotransferase